MAGLSGIVKKISDLVTGTPADDDCFVFGKSDLKKITLAKLKDALGITSLNSALINKQDLLVKMTPTESNFDELYTSGWYWINPTITNINAPVSEWGLLEIYNTGGIMQRFTTYSVTQESKQYVRMYANSVWSLWTQL